MLLLPIDQQKFVNFFFFLFSSSEVPPQCVEVVAVLKDVAIAPPGELTPLIEGQKEERALDQCGNEPNFVFFFLL